MEQITGLQKKLNVYGKYEMFEFKALLNLPMQFSHYDVSLTFEIIASLNAQTDASIEANISQYRTEGPVTCTPLINTPRC